MAATPEILRAAQERQTRPVIDQCEVMDLEAMRRRTCRLGYGVGCSEWDACDSAGGCDKAHEAAVARARLIDAAPALLSALRFILAFYEPGQRHLDTEAWKVAEASARAAVAKAEGR